MDKVNTKIKSMNIEADAVLVGSVAKGTFLRTPDVDVFIRFAPHYPMEYMEKTGLEIARAVMPDGVAKYAEHPYLHGEINAMEVDIVPCYNITDSEKKISSVDRTPFHTEYVKNALKPGQRDEVRLLKAFMKGIGVYGAEARIRGFSGYLCELLVIKYGTFLEVLQNAQNWHRHVYLHLGNPGMHFNDPLVFIDPVDSNRNVASAVSEESKSTFILASREFLREPSELFFFPNPVKVMSDEEILDTLIGRGTVVYALLFDLPDAIDDVLYPQIIRTEKAFITILQDFIPINSFHYVDKTHKKVVFLIELERSTLPIIERHEGPPIWHENAEKFIERWDDKAVCGPYINGSRLYVDRIRKFHSLKDVLLNSMRNYKLGKYFDLQKNKMEIMKAAGNLDSLNNEKLTEFLRLKFPWKR